jgi:hypothetical protein
MRGVSDSKLATKPYDELKIEISFFYMTIPQSLLVHFIMLPEQGSITNSPMPLRLTTF